MSFRMRLPVLCLLASAAWAQTGLAGPMEVIRYGQWEGILATQRPNIVVVDLWASWCVSCIERFPEMVAMAERYAGRDVRFLTLNLDDPQDRAGIDWANEFLQEIGADFPNYHLAENLTWSFEQLDLLAIPVVLIYDGQGRERFRLTNDDPNNQFDEQDIEEALQSLLAELPSESP
jgi:thiol-disulfide isomerase/thioredoxin